MSAGFLNPMACLGGNMPSDPTGDLIARQKLAELLAGGKGRYNDTSPKQHPLQALAQVADGAFEGLSARQQIAAELARQRAGSSLFGSAMGGQPGATPPTPPTGPAGMAGTSSVGGGAGMTMPTGGSAEIQGRFTDALKTGGLTNPYGLAAMTAYAQHESRYSPGNIGGTWSDPSESGQAGTSGGILSWRDERLRNMQAATKGEQDPVTAQAKFALAENPDLTASLQNAKSPEEANALMAQAWKFAGYNRPGGGEYANRLATTQAYASRFAEPAPAQPGAQTAANPRADLPAEDASETAAPGTELDRTPEGYAIPPAPEQGAAPPDDLRAQLQAAFDEQQASQAASGAVMTMPGDTGGGQPAGDSLRAQLMQTMAAQNSREAAKGLGNPTNGTALGVDPRSDMPAAGARPVATNPMGDEGGTGETAGLPRTPEGFVIPPGPNAGPGGGPDSGGGLPPTFTRADIAALLSGVPMGAHRPAQRPRRHRRHDRQGRAGGPARPPRGP